VNLNASYFHALSVPLQDEDYNYAFEFLNPLITTLKLQSNGPSDSNMVIGTLAVGGWAVTFGTMRGLGGCSPPRPLLTVPNLTTHPSTASVPTSYLFNVAL